MRAISLFSGIGGLDLGLESAGIEVVEMCESWEPARRVLKDRFPRTPVHEDVATYLPESDYEVLAAGFPCTDLSHAGDKKGIFGPQSGLVEHAFRIAAATTPRWIVLENVPNLLLLHSGAGITYIVDQLEALGYRWAYRTVDSRFTGVPQRRNRVILLASRDEDPAARLFVEPADPPASTAAGEMDAPDGSVAHGFYWTEGRNGIGLVSGAVPTLKGGSTLGAPSEPAIWLPKAKSGRRFVLPTVEDGEELQGLPRGWTEAAAVAGQRNMRWKLVGNAVTSGVGHWVGTILASPGPGGARAAAPLTDTPAVAPAITLQRDTRWPKAAAGGPDEPAVQVEVSDRPLNVPMTSLEDVIDVSTARALSHRATKGFLSRLDEKPGRKVNKTWYADLEDHLVRTAAKVQPSPESWASSPGSRARMRKQKQRDTKPELAMRRELTALGLRYRLQRRPVEDRRARLDIVFIGAKVAVDIRGCFWHACPIHGTKPRLNGDRWAAKLERNKQRDTETVAALEENGWHVVVVWEHDDPVLKANEVAAFVATRTRPKNPTGRGRNTTVRQTTGRGRNTTVRQTTGRTDRTAPGPTTPLDAVADSRTVAKRRRTADR